MDLEREAAEGSWHDGREVVDSCRQSSCCVDGDAIGMVCGFVLACNEWSGGVLGGGFSGLMSGCTSRSIHENWLAAR